MASITGVVDFVTQRGKAFNAKIDGEWYGCGFEEPAFKKGDTITANTVVRGRFTNIDTASAKVVEGGAAPASASGYSGNRGSQQSAINYQSARYAAIQFVEVAIGAAALPLAGSKENKLAALAAVVDTFTERYFYDTQMVSEGRAEEVFGKSAEKAVAEAEDELNDE